MSDINNSQLTEDVNPQIIVHHLQNSRSQRILWLLEELQVPYKVQYYARTPQLLAPPELLNVFPLGKSPVIEDVRAGITLAESGAIVEYLIKKYGEGKYDPPEANFADNLYFTHYAEGSVQPLLVGRLIFSRIPDRSPTAQQPIVRPLFTQLDDTLLRPELEKHGKYIENHLAKTGGYFASGSLDRLTSADFMMLLTLEIMLNRARNCVGPNVVEYVRRMEARPAYQRVLERGGEYAYVLKE